MVVILSFAWAPNVNIGLSSWLFSNLFMNSSTGLHGAIFLYEIYVADVLEAVIRVLTGSGRA